MTDHPSRQSPQEAREREAFIEANRHLDLTEVNNAWGDRIFEHSHVEASWLGWKQRAEATPPREGEQAGALCQACRRPLAIASVMGTHGLCCECTVHGFPLAAPPVTVPNPLPGRREAIAAAIRAFCQSLGAGSVTMSHGVERIYYAGISLEALAIAIELSISNPPPAQSDAREALQHALVRFECLADQFEEAGDTASWAMASVDADRMRAALNPPEGK